MKDEKVINLPEAVEVESDVQQRIHTVGVRGLDENKAKELGVFQRISYLLCACHATVMAAYRIYGGVDYLMGELNARRNEISREMNLFDKAFDRFVKFWTKYYAHGKSGKEVMFESERLFKQIMRWMQIPEGWQFGEPQRTHDDTEVFISFTLPDDSEGRVFTVRRASTNTQIVDDSESWGVFVMDREMKSQNSVYTNMDKASAMMVAKRLSDENKDNIYTAALMHDVVEKRTDVLPAKTFFQGKTIGKVGQTLKQ